MEPAIAGRAEYAGAATALSSTAGPSAASWPAIFAGAFVAAATSLILVALGAGLGFAVMSPWPGHGASATGFAITTAIWLLITQWLSAALGGYIAGRLRTRWVGTHTHEVFFRDTAHGLVTWAVATVLVAALFAAAAVSTLGAGARALGGAATAAAGGAAAGLASGGSASGHAPGPGGPSGGPPGSYELDRLFRSNASGGNQGGGPAADPRLEAARITANAITTGSVPDDDRQYLAASVAAHTGVSQADAEKRVDEYVQKVMDGVGKAKAAADTARKAAAQAALYTALAMLIGAFIASVSAALGGHLRDQHV